MATFGSNEHGLNFLSESEVESKPQPVAEPPAPVETPTEVAPPESSGFGSSGADEGWVEQGGDRNAGDQEGDDSGMLCMLFYFTPANICLRVKHAAIDQVRNRSAHR